jgi:hypothetical protein
LEVNDCGAFIQKLVPFMDNYFDKEGQLQQQPTTPMAFAAMKTMGAWTQQSSI